jgi:hypothetical protein
MATVGAKRKRRTYKPPTELGPFQRHPVYGDYVGWPDGTIWSSKSGKFIEGGHKDGYRNMAIAGKYATKHRFNFEIANQRVIGDKMDIDHINGDKNDNSWGNL